VHVANIGNAPVSDAPIELTTQDGFVRFSRTMKNIPPSPTFKKAMRREGNVDRWTNSVWIPPSHFQNEVHAAPAGRKDDPAAICFHVMNSLTPETERSTHYFYAVVRNFALDDPSMGEFLGRENNAAFHEDRVVIEVQQQLMDIENPPTPIMPIAADRGVLAMRRILEKMERDETVAPIMQTG
jgi:phenylpropionate dioxygenase-like ring-hydroxylating dioxygenase large terminal subunit